MDDLRYKQISEIVGIGNNSLLKVSLEIQTNHIKMKTLKLTRPTIDDFIEKINKISFENKIKDLKEQSNQTDEDLNANDIENDKKDYYCYLEYIKSKYIDFLNETKWIEEPELLSNLDNYRGISMPIVKWISGFSNEILDDSIMEFVPAIVKKITPIDIDENYLYNNFPKRKYYVYVGSMEKYKCCIGSKEKTRDNKESPVLVSFPSKGKTKDTPGKLWCNEANLLEIEF